MKKCSFVLAVLILGCSSINKTYVPSSSNECEECRKSSDCLLCKEGHTKESCKQEAEDDIYSIHP